MATMTASRIKKGSKTKKTPTTPTGPVEKQSTGAIQTTVRETQHEQEQKYSSDVIVLAPARTSTTPDEAWTEEDTVRDTELLGEDENYTDTVEEDEELEDDQYEEEQPYARPSYETKRPVPPRRSATRSARTTEPVTQQRKGQRRETSTTTSVGFTRQSRSRARVFFAALLFVLEGIAQVIAAIWRVNWITKLLLIAATVFVIWVLGGWLLIGIHYGDDRVNDLVERYPRTAWRDANIGLDDSATHPSHVLVTNMYGRIYVLVSKGNHLEKSVSYVSPILPYEHPDRLPVDISFTRGSRPGLENVVITVGDAITGRQHFTLVNTGTTLLLSQAQQ